LSGFYSGGSLVRHEGIRNMIGCWLRYVRLLATMTVIVCVIYVSGCGTSRPSVNVTESEDVIVFDDAGRHEWVEDGQTNVIHGPRYVLTWRGVLFMSGLNPGKKE